MDNFHQFTLPVSGMTPFYVQFLGSIACGGFIYKKIKKTQYHHLLHNSHQCLKLSRCKIINYLGLLIYSNMNIRFLKQSFQDSKVPIRGSFHVQGTLKNGTI